MANDPEGFHTITRSLSDLSAQLDKTKEANTRRQLLKQMRLLLDKLDRLAVKDLCES